MMCILIILFIVLAVAVITDLLFDKVYNEWILIGIACGLIGAAWKGSSEGLLWALISMTVPVILLYPLFMIGGLGAGDIKLLAAVGCFLNIKETMICLGIAFLIGAVISILKMAVEHNFTERMKYLLSYIIDVFRSGEWKFYGQDIQEGKSKYKGKIHFTLPILLSVIWYKGGISW